MAVKEIVNLDIRPKHPKPVIGRNYNNSVAKKAGSFQGAMHNWRVRKTHRGMERMERETVADRALEVATNDPNAASVIDGMLTNITGTGLTPLANPYKYLLDWSDDETKQYQDECELAFSIWSKEADAKKRLNFWQIQYQATYSLLVKGEFFQQPVMLDDTGRTFSLALQSIDPSRVCTPTDLQTDKTVRDGIRFGLAGDPKLYFVSNVDDLLSKAMVQSKDCAKVISWIAHRPGMFHVFLQKLEDQIRGVSVLSPAMKFFKDLSDYLDFELVGAIIAASFAVFIETQNSYDAAHNSRDLNGDDISYDDTERFEEVTPGGVIYGGPNEKPHILKSERPGNTFNDFVERILRSVGASVGMPYEIISKDFSKTNYSSARAALLEAWKVFAVYQKWMVDSFCQPVWEMVIEEAWLRGIVNIPKKTDFYKQRHLLTRATWIPPKRGHVDPLKEIQAAIMAKNNNIQTLSQIAAEHGGNWQTNIEQRSREVALETAGGVSPQQTETVSTTGKEEENNADTNK